MEDPLDCRRIEVAICGPGDRLARLYDLQLLPAQLGVPEFKSGVAVYRCTGAVPVLAKQGTSFPGRHAGVHLNLLDHAGGARRATPSR